MLIEIKGRDNPYIAYFEQGRDFYASAKETNVIDVVWPNITNSFVTLSFENVRKKVFGPVYSDSVKVDEEETYRTGFNITNSNILVPGDLQITVYLNITDDSTSKVIKRYCLGCVIGHVKASSFAGQNIIITGDDNPEEVICDFDSKIETLNILVNRVQPEKIDARCSVIEQSIESTQKALIETNKKVDNLKPIRTVESIPTDFETGEYLFLEIK